VLKTLLTDVVRSLVGRLGTNNGRLPLDAVQQRGWRKQLEESLDTAVCLQDDERDMICRALAYYRDVAAWDDDDELDRLIGMIETPPVADPKKMREEIKWRAFLRKMGLAE
jgi:hypothetical protein